MLSFAGLKRDLVKCCAIPMQALDPISMVNLQVRMKVIHKYSGLEQC